MPTFVRTVSGVRTGPPHCGVDQAEGAGCGPYGESAEAGAAVGRGEPQVEVRGGLVVADLHACPVLVRGMTNGTGRSRHRGWLTATLAARS